MADYNCKLVIANMDEWEEHLDKVIKSKGNKSDEELLEEAVTFDFKFDTIPISKPHMLLLEVKYWLCDFVKFFVDKF